jgi:polyprenyl-phospho-N-acetylgalactosaminyl synthase
MRDDERRGDAERGRGTTPGVGVGHRTFMDSAREAGGAGILRAALDRSRVWILVRAYNEEPRIAGPLSALCAEWPNVLVVDDGSTDGTADAVRAHPVWLVRHLVNLGAGAALVTGIRFALQHGAEAIVTFDADGQHDAADIETLLAPLARGEADIVFGSRFLGKAVGMPPGRRLLLGAAVLVTRVLYGFSMTDAHNGMRAMSRAAASKLRITMNRMEYASELLESVREEHLSWTEVPVTIHYTAESLAKGQRNSAALGLGLRLLLEKLVR